MEITNHCAKCGEGFNHYESHYTDLCDPCTEKAEGKTIEALQKEAGKDDDLSIKTIESPNGYDGLSQDQKELFERVFRKHQSALGSEKKMLYSRSNIAKVEWASEENCLHVHFQDGEWWHYDQKETWY